MREPRTRFEARTDKSRAVEKAERDGMLADSLDVRKALMDRVKKGEVTLKQAQTELEKIKRNAKKRGKVTRQQAWSRG